MVLQSSLHPVIMIAKENAMPKCERPLAEEHYGDVLQRQAHVIDAQASMRCSKQQHCKAG